VPAAALAELVDPTPYHSSPDALAPPKWGVAGHPGMVGPVAVRCWRRSQVALSSVGAKVRQLSARTDGGAFL
jgi:hypothetical protein